MDRAVPAGRSRSRSSSHASAAFRGSDQHLPVRGSRVHVVFRILFATVRAVGTSSDLFFNFAGYADVGYLVLMADLPLLPNQL